jgi:hypothetical protein
MNAHAKMPVKVCYLCGEPLCEPIGKDHVPPKQLFARAIRKTNPLQLDTLQVHDACNKAYQLDEDYFVHTLMPFGLGSVSGRAVYDDILQKFQRREKVGLTLGVLHEFEPHPSGLVLPGGKVVKRFQGERIQRIAWKIVRGLFFMHHGRVLPAETKPWVSLTAPDEAPPEHFSRFMMSVPDRAQHGRYPGVFAYRFDNFSEVHSIHYWAFLIWDRLIMTVIFDDPTCARADSSNET